MTRRTREVAAQLAERVRKEMRALPFPTCATGHPDIILYQRLSLGWVADFPVPAYLLCLVPRWCTPMSSPVPLS